MSEKLFTYGTLRPSLYPSNIRVFDMAPLYEGRIKGFQMYNLGRFPAIIPGEGVVVGEIVETENLWTIDQYEGYRKDGDGLYNRKELDVWIPGVEIPVKCWVYYMSDLDWVHAEQVPKLVESGDWATVLEKKK